MKNIILFLLIFSLGFFYSCSDFLDKNPLDQISSEVFWNNQKDAEMALAGVYNSLYSARDYNASYNINRITMDALTDNAFEGYDSWKFRSIGKGIIESTTGGIIAYIYHDSYVGIAQCNFFLANIDRVKMDETTRNKYKGEVLCLRAFYYFNLSEFFGGVVLYTEPVTIDNISVKQSTKAEVVTQILNDLDQAISFLPDESYNGHFVKGTALGIKAKVLMHNNRWAEAASVANQVIQSGKFSLYNNYPQMFLTGGQENNPEIMFSVRYKKPDTYAFYGPDIMFGWWNILMVFQNFVDEFECTDGLSINQSPLYDKNNYKKNRDPRLVYTIRSTKDPIVNSVGNTWNEGQGSFTGYVPNKYIEPENFFPISYSLQSDQDFIHLRYADVLLTYAESKNETSGPDQSVYNAVNQVRQRVNMPSLPTGLSKEQMRDRIRHERRVEFGDEGTRYFDLKRWRIAETVIPGVIDPDGSHRVFNPGKHYLFPFQQYELDGNPLLEQNPGY